MPGVSGTAGGADQLGQLKETLLTLPEEVIKDVGLEVTAATTSKCGGLRLLVPSICNPQSAGGGLVAYAMRNIYKPTN